MLAASAKCHVKFLDYSAHDQAKDTWDFVVKHLRP